MTAIRVRDLTKVYGEVRAVDGVDLDVADGEFVGVLGPNGAGKTTLLEVVEGLRRPDSGTVEVLGEQVWPRNAAVLPRIGVQLQASAFFERLTAREQIRTFAALYDVSPARADDWLERVGLAEKASARVEDLSGGQAIGRCLDRAFELDGRGIAFYDFAAIGKPKPYKDAYRARLDALGTSPEETERVVAEVKVAFGLNQALFEELGRDLPRWRRAA